MVVVVVVIVVDAVVEKDEVNRKMEPHAVVPIAQRELSYERIELEHLQRRARMPSSSPPMIYEHYERMDGWTDGLRSTTVTVVVEEGMRFCV